MGVAARSGDDAGVLEALAAIADVEVLTGQAERELCSSDVYSRGPTCLAVVRPRTAQGAAMALQAATRAGIAVYPRGGGLTYSSGFFAEQRPGLVFDTSCLNRIIDLDPRNMYITVESGVTWKQIHEALRPHGLRLPCFGTFSGAAATVGGGLSSGALFLGTARYGTVADSLLGLEVALADGTLLRTGQSALRGVSRPAYRTYGPDLTGPFVHDCGALGVKTRATFRLIRAPQHTGYASFAFPNVEAAAEALSEIARAELAEDAYAFDPQTTRASFEGVDLRKALRTLAGAARSESSALKGLGSAMRLAWAGAREIDASSYSVHMVAAARNAEGLAADLQAARDIAHSLGGFELPDVVPRGARASLFPALNDVLGARGDRWIAVNAKVPHTDALQVHAEVDRILAAHAAELEAAQVRTKRMFIAISNHSFSYEPCFMWFDEWLPVHRHHPEPQHLARFKEPAPNPAARAVIERARGEILSAFARLGAASNQIGRLYAYGESLEAAPRRFLSQIKSAVDPAGLVNPGVLGLSGVTPPTT
jgi:D-lactate dehydrogenase (cytochrome)